MAHAILATVVKRMFWFRDAFYASAHDFSLLIWGGLSTLDAVTPKLVFSRLFRASAAKEIRESRILTAGTLSGLIIVLAIRYIRSPWRKVPPGPRRLPIIGNAFQLANKSWLFSRDCKERFGESLITYPRIC